MDRENVFIMRERTYLTWFSFRSQKQHLPDEDIIDAGDEAKCAESMQKSVSLPSFD
jgi:hypothetical protein